MFQNVFQVIIQNIYGFLFLNMQRKGFCSMQPYICLINRTNKPDNKGRTFGPPPFGPPPFGPPVSHHYIYLHICRDIYRYREMSGVLSTRSCKEKGVLLYIFQNVFQVIIQNVYGFLLRETYGFSFTSVP